MNFSIEAIEKELKNHFVRPIYVFHGDESFFYEHLIQKLLTIVIPVHEKAFNQFVKYGNDIDVQTLLADVKRFPMMAEKQMVVIKGANNIQGINDKNNIKQLEQYLANPLTSTVLVLQFDDVLDEKKTWIKNSSKEVAFCVSKKMYDNKVPEWLGSYCRDKGVKISLKAIALIIDNIGNEPKRIAVELDKILTNLTVNQEISAETVQRFVGFSKDFNVFELQKALIVKDVDKANHIVIGLTSNPKANPLISILTILFNFYSKLLIVQVATDQNEKSLASAIGVNAFFMKDYFLAKKNYSLTKNINIISYLKRADLEAKGVETAGLSDISILKGLIFKILH